MDNVAKENFGYFTKHMEDRFRVSIVIETSMTPFQLEKYKKTLGYASCFH